MIIMSEGITNWKIRRDTISLKCADDIMAPQLLKDWSLFMGRGINEE